MNGVCVIFVGWLNIVKLDGVGYLMFDEETAKVVLVPLYKLNEWMKAWRTLEFSNQRVHKQFTHLFKDSTIF